MSGGRHEVLATFWLLDAPMSLLLQSESQPDGVGLGTFDPDGSPRVYRKPVAANRSETFIAGAQQARSRTFLSHIRHATAATPNRENTHPFEQKGRLLAHNGVLDDLEELRSRLGEHADLIRGETDSELLFTLITKRIDDHDGDIGAGITAAAREIAAEITMYSLNVILTTPDELWALRYPETNELWILERSGSPTAAIAFDERSLSGVMRVQSAALSMRPSTVIASEPMDADPGWRLLEPGELIHVDPDLRVTSTIAVTEPPAHMMVLGKKEAVAQAQATVLAVDSEPDETSRLAQ
jgi:glutamine amidotransferase